ncbi:MAG: permease prefix domain 1-containing protein [Agathobaculum sp.]|jgi:hypothetical protein|uniref:permease prefix domain 1-containing protein n=1 Tax=Agathobaculum sp. TaxID=2048138 RepID=UPI003D9281BD
MRLPEALQQWLDTAAGQMRWKRARPVAAKELADHMEDQYAAFLEDGMEEDAAAAATVREMGDPVETGTRLDRAWRPQPNWVMLGLVLAIAAVGCVLQYLLRTNSDLMWYTLLGHYAVGAVCLLAAYFVDYTLLGRHLWIVLGVWFAAVLLGHRIHAFWREADVLVSVGTPVLWTFPLLLAGLIYRMRGKGMEGVANCLMAVVAVALLARFGIMEVVYDRALLATCGVILLIAVWHGVFGPRRAGHMALAALPIGYAAVRQAMDAVFYADLMSDAKYQYSAMTHVIRHLLYGTEIPFGGEIAAHPAESFAQSADTADHLLTLAQLRWGWLAVLAVLLPLLILFGRGLLQAGRQSGQLAWLVSHAVVLTLAAQTLIYLFVDLGLIGNAFATGLPLLSYGGAYLCQTMLLLGVLLSAQRCGALEAGAPPVQASDIGG